MMYPINNSKESALKDKNHGRSLFGVFYGG